MINRQSKCLDCALNIAQYADLASVLTYDSLFLCNRCLTERIQAALKGDFNAEKTQA